MLLVSVALPVVLVESSAHKRVFLLQEFNFATLKAHPSIADWALALAYSDGCLVFGGTCSQDVCLCALPTIRFFF